MVNSKEIIVWDLCIRITHWSLVFLFLFLIVTGEMGDDWLEFHMKAGYLFSGLLVFRITWGFIGSYHARFWTFIYSPKTIIHYTINLIKGSPIHYIGHNPAGGIMVIILLLALSTQVITGLVTTDDILWSGPFYNRIESSWADIGASIHRIMESYLKILVLLHILAVVYHKVRFKENLVSAMWHGKKKLNSEKIQHSKINIYSLIIALFISALIPYWLWGLPI